jgi:DegV family protein with EDD domain
MSKVLVMTDTVACIPKDLAREYNIKVVPAANIFYDGHEYIDGVTLIATDAYQLIKKDPDRFVTSALTPAYLAEEFGKASKETQNILFITLSSALSAASKTAQLAAELSKEKTPQTTIRIFDSKTVGGAQGLIALAAAKAATKGMSLDDIASIAEKARQQTHGLMMLDTLRYVYRTGRMSKMGSRIAAMFNIKPINRMTDEGKLEMVDRTRNRDDGLEILINLIQDYAKTDALHFIVSHADASDMANQFSEMLKQKFNCLSLIISDYSPVMGYGSGPGAIFVGFQPELDLSK